MVNQVKDILKNKPNARFDDLTDYERMIVTGFFCKYSARAYCDSKRVNFLSAFWAGIYTVEEFVGYVNEYRINNK